MGVALITGTSTGIGLSSALHFARKGYQVFAGMRNLARSEALVEAARAESLPVTVCELDVTDARSIERGVQEVHDKAGPVDVLVNNAGIGAAGPLEEVPEEEHRLVFETNYWGAIRMTLAVLPRMRERRSGAIVNISSIGGRVPLVCQVPYASSKFALEGASEVLAQELRPFGIRVAIVEPGVIQTHIWENSVPATHLNRTSPYRNVMRRNGRFYARMLKSASSPELVAEAIYEAATSETPRLRHLVGHDAQSLAAGRAKLSDEEWIALCDDMTDEEYSARFRRYFGLEI